LAIDDGEIKVPKAQRQQVIESISRQVFKPLSVASALAEPCLEIRFRAASEEFNLSLWNVAAIAAFFMKCHEEMKPSVNKAFFSSTKVALKMLFRLKEVDNISHIRSHRRRLRKAGVHLR